MAGSTDNIQTYRQMLELDRSSRVFTLLAEELCAAGEWEEAAKVCRKGLLFHPNHLRSKVLLGWALMEMGRADQSERILLGAAEDIRKNAIVFKLLSDSASFSGDSGSEYARIFEAFQTAAPAADPIAEEAACPEIAGRITPEVTPGPKFGLDDLLASLADRIEERFAQAAPPPASVLSEEERNVLREKIIAALSGAKDNRRRDFFH